MRRIDLKRVSVARSNTIRDINRQIVLNYVREKGPISRADIARETDLQRSTVSLIVSELQKTGLIKEVYGESSGGRPPALLTLRTARPIAVGVDLGTTKTSVATCDLTGRVIKKEEFWTDPDAEKTTALIIDSVRRLTEKDYNTIEGIGISLPALVDAQKGVVLYSPHFKWRSPKIIEDVAAATGFPVTADNDANAAALAELWFGRPEVRDARDFILVFIENGIGTGIVFDGQIYRGKGGVAGEFGHMRIGTDAPVLCATGSNECWEAFASERAALGRYAKLIGDQDYPNRINFVQLVELAITGEKNALAALRETAQFIGIGMGNLIQGLSPDVIVVGGTIVNAWDLLAPEIQSAAEAVLCQGIPETRIIASSLGTEPALMGAFSLVLADMFATVSL
jgi:predicted NBD/HSP70 family sugar kinase